jgi:hypothetical protein
MTRRLGLVWGEAEAEGETEEEGFRVWDIRLT